MSQARVQAQCSIERLCSVQSTARRATKRLTLMANGILDIFLHRLSSVFHAYFSSWPLYLLKTPSSDISSSLRNGYLLQKPVNPDLKRVKGIPKCLAVLRRAAVSSPARTQNDRDVIFICTDPDQSQSHARMSYDVCICRQKGPVQENIMSFPSNFASLWDESLRRSALFSTIKSCIQTLV